MLTIAIPTFARAQKLSSSLQSLLVQIELAELSSKQIRVMVSDNHSPDATPAVVARFAPQFRSLGVDFLGLRHGSNIGFGANLGTCYQNCQSEFIWYLADDDVLLSGAVQKVVSAVKNSSAGVHLFNFDQNPYDKSNPLILRDMSFIGEDKYSGLEPLFRTPKLSSLVLRHIPKEANSIVSAMRVAQYFGHVTGATEVLRHSDSAQHHTGFVASPDIDYLDHIRFPPYIGCLFAKEILEYCQSISDASVETDIVRFIPKCDAIRTCSSSIVRGLLRRQPMRQIRDDKAPSECERIILSLLPWRESDPFAKMSSTDWSLKGMFVVSIAIALVITKACLFSCRWVGRK